MDGPLGGVVLAVAVATAALAYDPGAGLAALAKAWAWGFVGGAVFASFHHLCTPPQVYVNVANPTRDQTNNGPVHSYR